MLVSEIVVVDGVYRPVIMDMWLLWSVSRRQMLM